MNILFWCFFIINLLLLLLVIAGKGFRAGFGANTDLNSLLMIVVVLILIASLVLKFAVKQKTISLIVAALPVAALLVMYIFEKKS